MVRTLSLSEVVGVGGGAGAAVEARPRVEVESVVGSAMGVDVVDRDVRGGVSVAPGPGVPTTVETLVIVETAGIVTVITVSLDVGVAGGAREDVDPGIVPGAPPPPTESPSRILAATALSTQETSTPLVLFIGRLKQPVDPRHASDICQVLPTHFIMLLSMHAVWRSAHLVSWDVLAKMRL